MSHRGRDGQVVRRGVLEKEGGFFRTWKRRYFVLRGAQLQYFASQDLADVGAASAAQGSIAIAGATVRAPAANEVPGKPCCIAILPSCASHSLVLSAGNAEIRAEWIASLVLAGAHENDIPREQKLGSDATLNSFASVSIATPRRSSHKAKRLFPTSSFEGWLQKLGGINKNKLSPRYFVILGSRVLYFLQVNEESFKGDVDLRGCRLEHEPEYSQPHAFSLTPKNKPRPSLLTSFFGEVLPKKVLVASSEQELDQWMRALQAAIDRCAVAEVLSDESDDDSKGLASRGDTPLGSPLHSSPCAQGAHDDSSFTVNEAPPFVAPTGDFLGYLFRISSDSDDASVKKRYCALDVKAKTLRVWKHKPHARDAVPTKPKVIELEGATVTINSDLRCSKVDHHPAVLTITFPAVASSSPLHLAPPSRIKLDELHALLLLTLTKSRASHSSPPVTPPRSRRPSQKHAASSSAAADVPTGPLLSQAEMLSEMSLALGDEAALAHFRSRSIEFAHGEIDLGTYFKSYWRLFGKENGLRFWSSLVELIPKEQTRAALNHLFDAHRHLFTTAADADDSPTESPSTDPSVSPVLPSFVPSDPHSSTPSFTFNQPTAASSWSSPAPIPPTSGSFTSPSARTPKPMPATPHRPSPVPSPTPSSAPSTPTPTPMPAPVPAPVTPVTRVPSAAELLTSRDEVDAFVSAWSKRCEGHIFASLMTLHEVLPDLCKPGQFIPFTDEYPTLREVKRTYLRALVVLHPDKSRNECQRVQWLSTSVFSAIQRSWEAYEKSEKKKAQQTDQ